MALPNDFSTAYSVACTPGSDAAATMTRGPDGLPVLVVYLDPVNMTFLRKPTATGPRELADFCRELAREAAKVAAEIDPDGEPAPPEPRFLTVAGDRGDSGAGF